MLSVTNTKLSDNRHHILLHPDSQTSTPQFKLLCLIISWSPLLLLAAVILPRSLLKEINYNSNVQFSTCPSLNPLRRNILQLKIVFSAVRTKEYKADGNVCHLYNQILLFPQIFASFPPIFCWEIWKWVSRPDRPVYGGCQSMLVSGKTDMKSLAAELRCAYSFSLDLE